MSDSKRHPDGSAGDANYGAIGGGYIQYRQPEPRIAKFILDALGDAETILNVGAGAGSYEPEGRNVTAVEPSESMRAQRKPHMPVAIDATAEKLPFEDGQFDASMATFTVHQWSDLAAGLAEMRRVTKGPVVILTGEPVDGLKFWLGDYAAEVLEVEARRYPPMEAITARLGTNSTVIKVPIPLNCVDGFNEAYYGRPEMFLDPGARKANSAWSFVDQAVVDRFIVQLSEELESGKWDEKYGYLRTQPEFEGSLMLVVGRN